MFKAEFTTAARNTEFDPQVPRMSIHALAHTQTSVALEFCF